MVNTLFKNRWVRLNKFFTRYQWIYTRNVFSLNYQNLLKYLMTTPYIYYGPIGSFSESSTISRRFFAFFHGNRNMIVERKASYVKFLALRHLVERMQNELYLLVQEKKKKTDTFTAWNCVILTWNIGDRPWVHFYRSPFNFSPFNFIAMYFLS